MFTIYIYVLTLLFVYMSSIFVVSLIKKDNGVADIAYGIGFIIAAWSSLFLAKAYTLVPLTIASLITVWGIRLAIRIHRRNAGKPEDFRYKKWRDTWVWFKTRSFFQVYMLQGAIIAVIASVSVTSNIFGTDIVQPIQAFFLISGVIVWAVGFYFESIGDYQLDRYIQKKKENPTGTPNILTTGLWAYTRHPNYFGEVSQWWGLWIISLSVVSGWYTIASPLLITYLILKVSGIPMLEEKYKDNVEYQEYKKVTNAFFPWKRKSSTK